MDLLRVMLLVKGNTGVDQVKNGGIHQDYIHDTKEKTQTGRHDLLYVLQAPPVGEDCAPKEWAAFLHSP